MTLAGALSNSLLPFLAFLVSASLLARSIDQPRTSRLTFLTLTIMALAQTCGFMAWPFSEAVMFRFADAYLIAGYWLFATLLLFINSLSQKPIKHLDLVYFAAAALSLLHLFGLLTDGYRIENESPMHNNGPLAWVGDIYHLTCLLGVFIVITLNLKRNDETVWLSKNILFLVSLIPMMIVFSIVIVLSMTDNAVSLAWIGPLIMLWAASIVGYLSKRSVLSVSFGFRWLKTRMAFISKLVGLLSEGELSRDLQRSMLSELEKQSIREALAKHDSNILHTAASLGWDHTILRKKLKYYGLIER